MLSTISQPTPCADAALLEEARRLIAAYSLQIGNHYSVNPQEFEAGRALLEGAPRLQIQALFALLEGYDWRLGSLQDRLYARNLPWTAGDLERLLALSVVQGANRADWGGAMRQVHRYLTQGSPLTPLMEQELRKMRCGLQEYKGAVILKLDALAASLLGDERAALPDEGEGWADGVRAEIGRLPLEQQSAWKRLFAQAQTADGARPKATWSREAAACVAGVGEEAFRASIVRWFGLVTVPPMKTVRHEYNGRVYENQQSAGTDRNISLLKGLAWMCAGRTEVEVVRALSKLVEGCLKKQPGVGPWAVRAASAALWVLAEMECNEAVGQLGRLKTKVTFRTALGQIENALQAAAQRAGVTKADLEDLSVPTYGFDSAGVRREAFGDCAAVATLTAEGEMTVEWFNAAGRAVKSPPAEVRKEHAAALKEFKSDLTAAVGMLSAQKARFDAFYLPQRVWTVRTWRERFETHPLLGRIAKRLIWQFSEGERIEQGLWNEACANFTDSEDAPIPWLADHTEMRLWHPIDSSVGSVLAWRDALQRRRVQQPFKQAYREIYLLTEAERNTRTYSNRFAGHLLKQHQMNTLAALRGWSNRLRLMVDDSFPPAFKSFPEYGLRAEFWIEGMGDAYGTDTTDSGAYLYLTTDQVRFYPIDSPGNFAQSGTGNYASVRRLAAGPLPALPLTEVPALLFSEVMRDVDLFVGVCSVGNDPAWQDGGPQGRYRDYWSDYSFGDLSVTAQTRRAVLERLLPRLKIAARCSLTDRFLVVKGDLRTYKIHLGSGNILMEPNDQYLCIVQDRSTAYDEASVRFLPFEGDQRLALILSKALLLADDARITDPTITRQIQL